MIKFKRLGKDNNHNIGVVVTCDFCQQQFGQISGTVLFRTTTEEWDVVDGEFFLLHKHCVKPFENDHPACGFKWSSWTLEWFILDFCRDLAGWNKSPNWEKDLSSIANRLIDPEGGIG